MNQSKELKRYFQLEISKEVNGTKEIFVGSKEECFDLIEEIISEDLYWFKVEITQYFILQ